MKKIKLLLIKSFFQIIYQYCLIFCKFNPQKVTLATNRNQDLFSGLKNLQTIFEEQSNYQIKVIAFKFERSLRGRLNYFYYSIVSMHALATSRFFIVDDYYFPIYCIKKNKKNIVVQIWHAIGHLKRFGLSIESNKKQIIKPHTNYDYAVVNSQLDIPFYAEAFDMRPEDILAIGSPKIDRLINHKINNDKVDVRTVLYAPTFRRTDEENIALVQMFIKEFVRDFKDDILYVSLHPYMRVPEWPISENVHIFQDSNRIDDILSQVDILITDYSSVMLEFFYFERPVLIYAPDFNAYKDDFGFYVDFKSYIEAPIFDSLDSLMLYMKSGDYKNTTDYILKMKNKIFDYYDGQNSQRLFDFLTKEVEG